MAIFLSYRRNDSLAIVGRIDDYLRAEFGTDGVYRDLEDIPLGIDFVQHLEHALSNCDVLLVVIGPRWVSERLQSDTDFVRSEVEAALRRNIPTIPLLVEGASLPTPEQLPPTLQPLLRRQTIEIESGTDFKSDVARLAAGIRRLRGGTAVAERRSVDPTVTSNPPPEPRSKRFRVLGLAAVPLVIGGLWLASEESTNTNPPPAGGAFNGSCQGAVYGSACWYFGAPGESCEAACSSHGGVASVSAAMVGTPEQGGTLADCEAIMNLLRVDLPVQRSSRSDGLGVGCHLWGGGAWWLDAPVLDSSSAAAPAEIVCGCEQ